MQCMRNDTEGLNLDKEKYKNNKFCFCFCFKRNLWDKWKKSKFRIKFRKFS